MQNNNLITEYDINKLDIIYKDKSFLARIVSKYLIAIDKFYVFINNSIEKLENIEIKSPKSSFIWQFTLISIVLVSIILFLSCVTDESTFLPKPIFYDKPIKKTEKLYIKKENTYIITKEKGSKTGSIWADTKIPRNLFNDYKPSRVGEVVTIIIPNNLSELPIMSNNKESKKTKDNNNLDFSDPYNYGRDNLLIAEPIKEFKMEIVGIEPTGDVYLRGIKDFTNSLGEKRSIMILAKTPKYNLNSYEISAEKLTSITLNEENNDRKNDYASNGWDKTISRRLSGYTPDIANELSSIDSLREEIAINQKALQEQTKALNEEKKRLIKERDKIMISQNNQTPVVTPNIESTVLPTPIAKVVK